MKVIKQKIAQDLTKNFDPSQNASPQKNMSANEVEIQNIFKIEYDKIMKENAEQRNEYEKKLNSKNAQINHLNTSLANTKTEVLTAQEKADSYADQNQELQAELMKLRRSLQQAAASQGQSSGQPGAEQLKSLSEALEMKDKQINHMYSFDRFDVALDSKTTDAFFKKVAGLGKR